ncbi:MAG TPA: hypothetical protein PLJ23_06355 [Gemmatimonadales bacterium]|jgi:hypothetical protein|nr:hypothetical protein [Gemmatimonadales bacterium]
MRHTPLLATMALTAMGAHSLAAQTMRSVATSRPLSGERMLRASIEFGAGTVHVGPAASGDLYRMQLRYDADRNGPVNQFDAATGAVRLGLQGNGNAGIRVTSRAQMAQRAEIGFAPGVPLMLSANLGASDATLDLGGLSLTSLAVRGGASSTTVNFDTPNRATCSSATFTLGAAEFDVSGLANSGCAEIRVDGGVGRAMLSFDGAWQRNQRAQVSLAMGGLTLRIPRSTGVRLVASRFLSALDAEGFVQEGKVWSTPGFATAKQTLTVELKTSASGVRVEWLP